MAIKLAATAVIEVLATNGRGHAPSLITQSSHLNGGFTLKPATQPICAVWNQVQRGSLTHVPQPRRLVSNPGN